MIFPKDQKFIRPTMNEQLKREALELIICLYLERSQDEEIAFLKNNFGTSKSIARGIRTDLFHGLSQQNIDKNRIDYGQNSKREPKKCSSLFKIIKNQVLTLYFSFFLILFIIVEIYDRYSEESALSENMLILFLANISAAFIRVIIEYVYSRKFVYYSSIKDKTSFYQVYRNGKFSQIKEHQILVGDIVQLGFKQKVPATGLLISNKEIFVKEEKGSQKVSHKMSLENCLKKINNMGALDLKLCYEQRNLPSPVLKRGSELIYGSTFKLMVLSVTEEDLLHQYDKIEEDKFSFKEYTAWINKLQSSWQKKTFLVAFLMLLIVGFTDMVNNKIIPQQNVNFQFFLTILIYIASVLLVLNPFNIGAFLRIYQLLLFTTVEYPENIVEHLTVERIICDEKNIISNDIINAYKYAVCEKMDLTETLEAVLHPLTVQLIKEIQNVFDLKGHNQINFFENDQRVNKFVIMNKKKCKIISCPTEQNQGMGMMQKVFHGIAKVSSDVHNAKQHRISLRIQNKQMQKNQKLVSQQFLTLSKDSLEIENLNEIINSRCKIKSRGIMEGFIELAEKGCKTYYYLVYESQKMDEITHVVINGLITPISQEDRERMKVLARKISLVHNLAPIMLGFHEGPYRTSLRILVCIVGVSISEQNQMLLAFKQFEHVGIKSIIAISKSWVDEELNEEDILSEYQQRKWITEHDQRIQDIDKIKKRCGRLVCSSCLISNCDCKDKIEELSHIQPLLSNLDLIKIIHNLDEFGISYLEKAFNQLKYNLLTIQSTKKSMINIVDSIKQCVIFVEGLRRNLPLFYLVSLIYFVNPAIFRLRSIDVLTMGQVALYFGVTQILLFFCSLTKFIIGFDSIKEYNRKKICLLNKKETLFIYNIAFMTLCISHLLFYLSYLIPQEKDGYDLIITENQLPSYCKYSEGYTVTNTFKTVQCSYQGTTMFSKISTMILIYLYYAFWSSVVVIHHNIRSYGSIIIYLLSFVVGVAALMFPEYALLYKFRMTPLQGVVIIGCVLSTLLVGKIITEIMMIYEDFFSSYFEQQLESSIDFGIKESEKHYSQILKRYHQKKMFLK